MLAIRYQYDITNPLNEDDFVIINPPMLCVVQSEACKVPFVDHCQEEATT